MAYAGAPSSGSGKTALACALLAALQNGGSRRARASSAGPIISTPMFHRSVLAWRAIIWTCSSAGEDAARTLYARHAAGHGAAVVEGVMGFTTAWGGVTARASAWHGPHAGPAGAAGAAPPGREPDAGRAQVRACSLSGSPAISRAFC